MHRAKFNSIASLALFGATMAVCEPRLNARMAKKRLTAAAFPRVVGEVYADGAHKEVRLFFGFLVCADKVVRSQL